MKITVGVKNIREAIFFLQNGADEIYFGFNKLKNNRTTRENFTCKRDVLKLLEISKEKNRKVLLAINEIIHEKDFKETLSIIEEFKKHGLGGIIVRDPAFLCYLKKKKFRFYCVLSTLANSFNFNALKFYVDLGISRVVLPMQLTFENAEKIINNSLNIETEIFCQPLYWGVNVDSKCFLPCPQTGRKEDSFLRDYPCLFKFKTSENYDFVMPMPNLSYLLGSFYDYYHGGVNYVKVARWSNFLRQADVFFKVKYLLELLRKKITREAFVAININTRPLNYGQTFTYKSI